MRTEQIMCLNLTRSKGEDCGHVKSIQAPFPPPPPKWNTFHWPFQGGSSVMVYFCYSSSLNVCVVYIFFVLDSHLATLWESNCPFGFLLVMFQLGSSYFVFVFLFLWCLWWEVWDDCIDSWSLPSFLFWLFYGLSVFRRIWPILTYTIPCPDWLLNCAGYVNAGS